MATLPKSAIEHFGTTTRRVAAALIAGVCRSQSIESIEERLGRCPKTEQRIIVAAVLGAVFLLSLLAAQFGWIAMLGFWLIVIVVVN